MRKRFWIIIFLLIANLALAIIYFQQVPEEQSSFLHQEGNSQITEENFSAFGGLKNEGPEARGEVTLIAVGDVMLSRSVAWKIDQEQNVDYPFLKTGDYLKGADIVLGNLEAPITEGPVIHSGEMIFRADPGVEAVLKEVGFDVFSLANNHIYNFGVVGLEDTFFYLDQAGIKYAGAGQNDKEAYEPVYLERNGVRLAFLAFADLSFVPEGFKDQEESPSVAAMEIERMEEAVKRLRLETDLVIVSMHSGHEYVDEPHHLQVEFARAAIDAGAEMVIGHHPHVIQTAEKYKGKYIFYSLGNFVFDQMWSYETREGLVIKVFFDKSGVSKIELRPILIEDYCQPRFLEGEEKVKALEKLKIDLGDFLVE